MKFSAFLMGALLFLSTNSQAALTVIGDVDAPNTDVGTRPENFSLLENIRNGGTDIVWLTGGNAVNGRYTDLRSRWSGAGATLTDDLTTDVAASLVGRDLVVISQNFSETSVFDAGAIAKISNYLSNDGAVLYIAQVAGTPPNALSTSYNSFLSGIGSSIQFIAGGGQSGDEVINTGTSVGQGITEFTLGGWTALDGGTTIVSVNGVAGVMSDEIISPATPATPVPTLPFFGLLALGGLLGMFGVRQLKA